MSKRFITLFALTLLVYNAPSWSAHMPRGSFLVQPAGSAWQLATQVQRMPVVAARYERHFGIPAPEFARYVQSHCGVRRLKSTGTYRVFHIKKDGSIGSQMRRLRMGTSVFIHLRTGEPVLLAECGNPMSTNLPGYIAPIGQSTPLPVETPPNAVVPEPPVEEILPPVTTLEPGLLEDPAMAQALSADLSPWEADPILTMPDLPVSHVGALAYAAPASLAPLFTGGGVGIVLSLGGTLGGRGGNNPPPAIPEPSSLLLWGVAGTLLALAWWRRHRLSAERLRC